MRGLIASILGDRRIAVVSGGFDPVHSGHLRMLVDAQQYGPVHVIVNSDAWLARKKGHPFMPLTERLAVIALLSPVSAVYDVEDDDDTVCWRLMRIREEFPRHRITFCNGGDRVSGNTPEEEFCREFGIDLAYGVGGGKTQSSSALVQRAIDNGLYTSPR